MRRFGIFITIIVSGMLAFSTIGTSAAQASPCAPGVQFCTGDPVLVSPPVKMLRATRWIDFNGTPEPTVNDATTTIKGKLQKRTADNTAWVSYGGRTVTVQRKLSGQGFKNFKDVKLPSTGVLALKVKAGPDASWRVLVKANKSFKASTSKSDFVDVIQPKDYANCTQLRTVYPHGVGKKGAIDQGSSSVTNFTVDDDTYALNTESDADNDRIACERA